MRYSEFWELVEEVLGSAHGRELVATLVVGALENRTPAAAHSRTRSIVIRPGGYKPASVPGSMPE